MDALLIEGASVHERLDGKTLLMAAAGGNVNPAVAGLLLERGADPRAKDSAGATALDYAKNNPAAIGTELYWELDRAVHSR